ncbi:PQQ-binding-like beta-propeller repeat protein [Metabacillus herbersteinensis]|uniref:PQQ-binding-like beta-propeller repeat protein n=1 Tax=Metabacillus herbersteinensis TaxID=283816 RepID=A0ABV6GFS2_9BACI
MKFLEGNGKITKEKLKVITAVIMCGLAVAAVTKPVIADNTNVTVEGVVFVDKNENGTRDSNEQGIPNVSVSDGKTVTISDEEGNYTLTTSTDRRQTDIVFVTVPSGYSVPTDENKTPQFYKLLGNLKAGETSEQNFGLIHTPENKNPNFSFVNVADVHVQAGTTNNRERFTDQLSQINDSTGDPAFIAVSGDLTNRATDAEYLDYTASTATSTLPVYPAMGNHDFAPGSDYKTRVDRYRNYLGPEWYSFDYGNRHFVTLENTLGFSETEQLEWLKQDLAQNAKDKEVVVFVHKPLNTPQTPSADSTKQFIDLLGQYNTRLVMVGHTHVNDVAQDTIPGADHVTSVSSAYTIDQSPNGFRMVTFQGDEQDPKFKMYDVKKSASIVHPANNSEVAQDEMNILVNAYNTSSNVKKVEYRVDGGPWKKLKQSSGMSWYGTWDARKAKLRKHHMEVRVTDDAENVWARISQFSIVDNDKKITPKSGTDWTMFHGDAQHTGYAKDTLEAGLNLGWTYRTPGTILTSSPAIVDGIVYIGTRDEDSNEHHAIHAVNQKTGKKLWQVKADAQVQSSPAVADGIVYASSIRGTLYAMDAKTGKIIWEKSVGKDEVQRAWMYYSPTIDNGVVYQAYSTGSGGAMMALDANTGEELWNAPLAGGWIVESTPVVQDGKVYVGADGGWLIAIDASTGKEIWRQKPAGGWMHSMPSISEGRVYMGYQGGLLVALDAATGKELWRYKSSDSSYIHGGATGSSAAVADGFVYMGFPDGNVVALDAATGSLKWKFRTQGGIISSAAVSGEVVFIGSNDGNLYAFDRLTGQPLWQHEIGAWVASSPAISGNTLVVGALDGNLYAFTPGGKTVQKWPRATGKVSDATTGKPVSGATIVATNGAGETQTTVADAEGEYVLGLQPGKYTLTAKRRGFLNGTSASAEMVTGQVETIDLQLNEITEPVAGKSQEAPDFNSGSPRLDIPNGEEYHYIMNDLIQATISSKIGANNGAGTFQPGWVSDIALLDNNATETLDWSEWVLSETMNDPKLPWNREGQWLALPKINVDGDTINASGQAQIDPDIKTKVTYKALPNAPIAKITLELDNTGTEDFKGYFQYLLDPDSADDTAFVPGIAAANPGFMTSGWAGNYIYDGPKTATSSPAHGIAWINDQPTGLSAFGYIFGVSFDASVAAGEKKSISWYHITDYPANGSNPAATIANWAANLGTLDPEAAEQSRIQGSVTDSSTNKPVEEVLVEALNAENKVVASSTTNNEGKYLFALQEPGSYSVRASRLSYENATVTTEVSEGESKSVDVSLMPVTVNAGTGKVLSGPVSEGTVQDIIMENSKLAMTIAAVTQDAQLPGVTKGKPIDISAKGFQDQVDWFNLPYISTAQPLGPDARRQLTVKSEELKVMESSSERAVVSAIGTSTEDPEIKVDTTYTILPNQEWITAETVFSNTGQDSKSVWIGDALDYDGAGQKSGVSGHDTITLAYSDPQEFTPTEPWIGMSGTDRQTIGLVYSGNTSGLTAYGNGNWIMSRQNVELAAGGSHTMERKIVATPSGSEDPFSVLSSISK